VSEISYLNLASIMADYQIAEGRFIKASSYGGSSTYGTCEQSYSAAALSSSSSVSLSCYWVDSLHGWFNFHLHICSFLCNTKQTVEEYSF
jgi:hypothetical protein